MTNAVLIRLTRPLVEGMQADLRRPHPYAVERVGFLFARKGSGPPGTTLLFPIEYHAVPDDQYIEGLALWEGAAINGDAMRSAMERVMATKLSALHVHLHDHLGRPRLSRTDWRDLPDVARSFRHADPTLIHGGIVLSRDAATGAVWLPDVPIGEPALPRISIVGYPLRIASSASQYGGDVSVGEEKEEGDGLRDEDGSL
ncbi:MAG TPA: hypothetical protein VJO13_15535 [Ktedonobacterales bacterium]|nr:hypothetical protein [Ktedonobacterales bacterium]